MNLGKTQAIYAKTEKRVNQKLEIIKNYLKEVSPRDMNLDAVEAIAEIEADLDNLIFKFELGDDE